MLIAPVASAAPLTWTIQDGLFDDGTALTGSFVYDASTLKMVNWDITVYNPPSLTPDSLTAYTYMPSDSTAGAGTDDGFFYIGFVDLPETRYVELSLPAALTNAGGAIPLVLKGNPNETFETPIITLYARSAVSGTVTTFPEPASAVLVGSACLLGVVVRRWLAQR